MIPWLKQYASTHLFYIIIFAVVAIAAHAWLSAHDSLVRAELQEKISEQQVQAANAQIKTLQQQIADSDTRAAQQIAALEKTIANVQTSQPVAQQLPTVAPSFPSPVAVQPDNSITFPKEDVLPLFKELADGAENKVKLTQCQTDYTAEKQIVAKKDEIIKSKDDELQGYKKAAKKGFWRKLGSGLKVGAAIAIAGIIGHYA